MKLVEPVIDEVVNDPAHAWADRYELYSSGCQVDYKGFPIYADEPDWKELDEAIDAEEDAWVKMREFIKGPRS